MLTEVALKTLPALPERATLAFQGQAGQAVLFNRAGHAYDITGAAWQGGTAWLRIEGLGPQMAYRRERLLALFKGRRSRNWTQAHRRPVARLRDVTHFAGGGTAGACWSSRRMPRTRWPVAGSWRRGLAGLGRRADLVLRPGRPAGGARHPPCHTDPARRADGAPSRRNPLRSPRAGPAAAGLIRRVSWIPALWRAEMQTNFTPQQLADPGTARANEILRSCVHCGFCTATCPTYKVLGDELDSPRGRIYLIKDMLENSKVPDAKTVQHIDRCLSCLSCMTTCPSGVHYMRLVDHAREYIEKNYRRPLGGRALRWLLARILPYPGRFVALFGAKLARPRGLVPDRRLQAMLDMAPENAPPT